MITPRRNVVGLVSCWFALCLSVPHSAQAINNFARELNEVKSEQRLDGQVGLVEKDEEASKGLHTLYGEVLQVKHEKYLVRKYNGDVVRLQIDDNTEFNGNLTQGDRIVAKVDEERHVLLIQSVQ